MLKKQKSRRKQNNYKFHKQTMRGGMTPIVDDTALPAAPANSWGIGSITKGIKKLLPSKGSEGTGQVLIRMLAEPDLENTLLSEYQNIKKAAEDSVKVMNLVKAVKANISTPSGALVPASHVNADATAVLSSAALLNPSSSSSGGETLDSVSDTSLASAALPNPSSSGGVTLVSGSNKIDSISKLLKSPLALGKGALALGGTGLVYNEYRKRTNRINALKEIVDEPSSLKNINESYKNDKDFLLEAISQNSEVFIYINKSITKNQGFCLKAISHDIEIFNDINNNLKNNQNFLLKAIIIHNDILSLMKEDDNFSEILKDSSFIGRLKTIEIGSRKLKLIIKELEKNVNLDNNSKKSSSKKYKKKTSKKNKWF